MSPVNVSSIGNFIREQREQAKASIRQLAQFAGVPSPYLSQIERGLRKPSADILQQLAKGLLISAEVLYVQAGILEDQPQGVSVRSAVLADPDLSERQKQMLVELYDSFRKEAALAATSEAALAAEPQAAGAAESEAALAAEPQAAGAAEPAKPWDVPQQAGDADAATEAEPGHMVPSPAASR
jgi:transcriptional regulator with XRE-family HTH domain